MRFSFDIEICAPRGLVFDFLGDPANRTRWQPSIRTFEMDPQGDPRVGIRWRESVRGAGTLDMEISEYERPVRWAERFRARAATGTVAMTFTEHAGGTTVTLDADVRLTGILRLVEPVLRFLLRREMRKDLSRVESLLTDTA